MVYFQVSSLAMTRMLTSIPPQPPLGHDTPNAVADSFSPSQCCLPSHAPLSPADSATARLYPSQRFEVVLGPPSSDPWQLRVKLKRVPSKCYYCNGGGKCMHDYPTAGTGKNYNGEKEYYCSGTGKCYPCGGSGWL